MARPVYVLQAAFATSPDDPVDDQAWTDITSRLDVQAGVDITFGRPDEFGDVVPSTLSATLKNSDGALTPGNAASPYYPNVKTGKYLRLGLMYPGAGVQYAEGDPSFEDGSTWTGAGFFGGPPPAMSSSALHPTSGSKTQLATWGTGGQGMFYVTQRGLVAGQQYTVALDVWVPTGSPNVQLGVGGITFGVATAVKNATVRLVTTFVATAVEHDIQLINSSAPGGAGTQCFADSYSCRAGTASAYVATPGVFSWRFTGLVTEWPLGWLGGPALAAETRLTAVDKLKRGGDLGEFRTFLQEDVLDDDPIAFYPLTEGANSTSAGDVSGYAQRPLTIRQVGTGGSITFGEDRVEIGGGDLPTVPRFYEDKATGVIFQRASASNGKYLAALLNTPTTGTAGATVMVYAEHPGGSVTTGTLAGMFAADGTSLTLEADASGTVLGAWTPAGGTRVTISTGFFTSSVDGYTLVLDVPSAGNGRMRLYWFGVLIATSATFPMPAVPSWFEVVVGGSRRKDPVTAVISHAQFYDHPLDAATIDSQVSVSWDGTGFLHDTTILRVTKLAGFAGFDLPISVLGYTAGQEQAAGPQEIEGNPIDSLQRIARTEGGPLYINGAGQLEMQMRRYRFNAAVALTLAADRLDPGTLSFRGDDFGLINDVTATRGDGMTARVVNESSRQVHGRRKGGLDTAAATDSAQRALAAWTANSYGVERNRVTGVRVSLLNDPALIPTVLGMGIGSKLRITSLAGQAPAAEVDLFVEGWTEHIGETEWTVAFNTSPAEVFDVWQIGVAGRSEIGTTTRIGY